MWTDRPHIKTAVLKVLLVAAGHGAEGHVQIPAEVRRGHGAGRMGPD